MTYLDDLLSLRREAVQKQRAARSLDALRDAAARRSDHRGFHAALARSADAAVRIVAEFKRASPSAGVIAAGADAAAIAAGYERGGAAAISVLTEPDRFLGGFSDLRAARAAVSLPVLCKDFIVDEYQVWEAAVEGADAILLIVAALDGPALTSLLGLASTLLLDALVEVHDEEEARRALAAGATAIGVNNRDLHTFAVDTSTARRVRASIPPGIVVVAESGYAAADEIRACEAAGIDAVLIGERLMREADAESALRRLRSGVA